MHTVHTFTHTLKTAAAYSNLGLGSSVLPASELQEGAVPGRVRLGSEGRGEGYPQGGGQHEVGGREPRTDPAVVLKTGTSQGGIPGCICVTAWSEMAG